MMPLPQTSTPGFKSDAQKLRDAVIATPVGSAEEAALFHKFRSAVMKESEAFLNSAMQATDSFCGYARGDFKDYSLRPNLLQSGMELLIDLADRRLQLAQTRGINEGDKEIEEPCNRLRNVMFLYTPVDGGACAARATELWLNLAQEWIMQKPEQSRDFASRNFRMNSDGAQNAVANVLRERLAEASEETSIGIVKTMAPTGLLRVQSGSAAFKSSPSPI